MPFRHVVTVTDRRPRRCAIKDSAGLGLPLPAPGGLEQQPHSDHYRRADDQDRHGDEQDHPDEECRILQSGRDAAQG